MLVHNQDKKKAKKDSIKIHPAKTCKQTGIENIVTSFVSTMASQFVVASEDEPLKVKCILLTSYT